MEHIVAYRGWWYVGGHGGAAAVPCVRAAIRMLGSFYGDHADSCRMQAARGRSASLFAAYAATSARCVLLTVAFRVLGAFCGCRRRKFSLNISLPHRPSGATYSNRTRASHAAAAAQGNGAAACKRKNISARRSAFLTCLGIACAGSLQSRVKNNANDSILNLIFFGMKYMARGRTLNSHIHAAIRTAGESKSQR